ARVGARVALRDREGCVTYAQLRDRSAAVAEALVQAGLQTGDRVVVHLEKGTDAAAAYFAVWAAGGVAVMANETVRARQLEYILRHAEASFLLTSATIQGQLHRPLQT